MKKQPSTSLSIKSWAEDDRPREKLQLKGRSALSDAELVAILLGSGSQNESAVGLAKKVLQSVDYNLSLLGRKTIEELTGFKGIGEAKAINIITALELGKRRRQAEALESPKITNSQHSFEILQPVIGDIRHEEFWVIYLSQGNYILSYKCISRGGITGTLADVRMVFKEAVIQQATGVVIAHNHPSGDVKPSQNDLALTKRMKEAGRIMDVHVLDHLIISQEKYLSFADEDIL